MRIWRFKAAPDNLPPREQAAAMMPPRNIWTLSGMTPECGTLRPVRGMPV